MQRLILGIFLFAIFAALPACKRNAEQAPSAASSRAPAVIAPPSPDLLPEPTTPVIAAAPVEPTKPKTRNIIFILTDDQRFDSLGCLNKYFQTPRLDELAKGGILFENAFVTTSLCSPSRASILTGQYAHVHKVLDNNNPMPRDTPIFPIELKKAGYDTAFIGKWHMGGGSDAPQPGFDRWVSFKGQGVYNNPTFNVDGESIPHQGYVTDLITDYAVDYLKREHTQPFMMYISHKAVHAEFAAAQRHKGEYKEKPYPFSATMENTDANYKGKPNWVRAQRYSWHGVDGMYNKATSVDSFARDYAETLRAVDDSVGRIMDTLRDKGMLDSTLIIFTSDNGFLFGEFGMIDKRSMYEPSIRVPLIAHCPDLFPGGQRRKEMITNLDYAPTILEVAGAPIPHSVQGKSFLPLLQGKPTKWRDAFLYEYFWERNFPQTPTVLGIRTDRYKFMKYHGIWDKYEIYDIQNDPEERNNLLGDFMIQAEAGGTEAIVRRDANPDLKKLFNQLNDRLTQELLTVGAAAEPNWTLE